MTARPPHRRLALAGLAGLAVFAPVFSLGRAVGVWPGPPVGGFAGTDLAAGLVFAVVLLAVLVRGRA